MFLNSEFNSKECRFAEMCRGDRKDGAFSRWRHWLIVLKVSKNAEKNAYCVYLTLLAKIALIKLF